MSDFASGHPPHPVTPIAYKAENQTIFSVTPLTANYQAGDVLDCSRAAACALTIKYDAHASSTTNQLKFLVFVSNHSSAPLITDDVWGALSTLDATPADAALSDTLPAGVDMTVAPAWGEHVLRPADFTLKAMTAGTHKQRPTLVVDTRRWRYLCVLAKEEGDTSNVGSLTVLASLSA